MSDSPSLVPANTLHLGGWKDLPVPVGDCRLTAAGDCDILSAASSERNAVRLDPRERLLRKELRKLLPVNKDDVAAIDVIAAQGYPAVQPILLDLLKWIRIESWPVAKPACEFLVTIGPSLAPQVREVFGSSDDSWKAVVLRQIVSEWPSEGVRGLANHLDQIATHGRWGADLLALRLLAKHAVGDPERIAGLLEFKRQHHEKRLSEIAEIRRLLLG